MVESGKNWRARWFGAIARVDVRRPWLVIAIAAALSLICVLYTKARLEFHTGQDDLISADRRDSRNYLRYTREFPDLDGLIIVVAAQPSAARAEGFVDALAARLNADHTNVKSVFYRVDPGMMGDRALLYLGIDDLNGFAQRINGNLAMLRSYAAEPTLARIFTLTNAQIDARLQAAMGADGAHQGTAGAEGETAASGLMSSETAAMKVSASGAGRDGADALNLEFTDALLRGMLADSTAKASSPWNALSPAGQENGGIRDGYLSSDNGKYLLLEVAATDGAANGPDPVDAIQGELEAMRARFPDVEAGMTGGSALARAEESTTQHDMELASVIAVVGLIALLVIPFRGVIEPLFAVLALLAGVAWSFGFTTLVVGHLNLLSAVFTSILAGIGINFPIHLMARYDEARRRGAAMPAAIELAVVNTGTGVFASACIMALAFLMPMFTDFRGIAELGEISAAGLFLCLVSALFVFPALIALRDRKRAPERQPRLSLAPRRSTLEKMFARPGLIIGVTAACTAAALILVRGVKFDQNVLKLQASDAEAVRFENILLHDSGRSSWFAVALARTRAGAERKAARFRKLEEVSDVETIGSYIPNEQAAKRAILASIKRDLATVTISPVDHSNDNRALTSALGGFVQRLAAVKDLDTSGAAAKTWVLAEQAAERLKQNPSAFAAYEHQIAAELSSRLDGLKQMLEPQEITERNLPAILRTRFIGNSGLYLVQVYPKGNVWEDAPLQRFVSALRTVDAEVTGPPVQTYVMASVMRRGYERAALLALIAVVIFVFADFRSLRDAFLVTVPLLFGGVWMLEAMGALGWDFNLANLFAVPIIIGMGVDNGVNMLYRWREESDKSSLILTKAVGKSVTICSLTTIAAFAALIPASHHGISSLGWVLTVGVSLILLATLIVLPALFELLGGRIQRTEKAGDEAVDATAEESGALGRSALNPPRKVASGSLRGR